MQVGVAGKYYTSITHCTRQHSTAHHSSRSSSKSRSAGHSYCLPCLLDADPQQHESVRFCASTSAQQAMTMPALCRPCFSFGRRCCFFLSCRLPPAQGCVHPRLHSCAQEAQLSQPFGSQGVTQQWMQSVGIHPRRGTQLAGEQLIRKSLLRSCWDLYSAVNIRGCISSERHNLHVYGRMMSQDCTCLECVSGL